MAGERMASTDTPAARGSQATEATLPLLTLDIASRLLFFERMLRLVADNDGDVVECGVGWGRSLLDWALLVRLEERRRHIWGFDSFEGFPEPSPEDKGVRSVQRGEWRTDLASVMKMLEGSGLDTEFVRYRVTLVKGFFADTLPRYNGPGIAVLHIDADLYHSYLGVLRYLYDRVVPGGVIVFDEYLNTMDLEKFPGASAAINEFFDGREQIRRDKPSGRYYVVRGGGE